jgi:site-specific DNA recombinase
VNGIIYCRVSSKEQIEGTSLESQELACSEYARAQNIKILKIFVERGESAKFADRTQLIELIDFCKTKKSQVQVLLVWKIDRFARNVGDHFSVKATLHKYGVRIVSVTEPIDTKPEGRLLETILAGFAQFDNDIRAARTVQGMRRKIQEGLFPWRPPLGYKSANADGEKKIEPDMPRQPLFDLLKKAWHEFATGVYTKAEIRRLMDAWGIQTARGETLSAQSLDHLFRNPYYAGVVVDPWTGAEYEAKHPPMVSREDFARVQEIIRRRNRSLPHQKERPEFPLRGFVRCPSCHGYMTASFSRSLSGRYPYYHCENRKCGSGKSYAAQVIHEEFSGFLDEIAPKPELMERLQETILQVAEDAQHGVKTQETRRQAQLARVNGQIHELIRLKTETLVTDEEFVAQKSLLVDRRLALERAAEARFDAPLFRENLDQIMRPLSELRRTWQDLPNKLRHRFQRMILPAGFVEAMIGTAELGRLFRVFRDFDRPNANGVAPTGARWNIIMREIKEFSELLRANHTLH